jgi:hypothetical protein
LQSIDVSGGGRGDPTTGRSTGGGGGAGGGLGLGPPAPRVVVRQDATTVTIEEHRESGEPTVIVIPLDGQRRINVVTFGGGRRGPVECTAKWDRRTLVVTMIRRFEQRGRVAAATEYREKRSLAADGAMRVETTVAGRPQGRTATYRREAGEHQR